MNNGYRRAGCRESGTSGSAGGGRKRPARDLAGRLPYGYLPAEDVLENERALLHGGRLFSAYATRAGAKLWVITEWDRGATTLLLPEEY